MFVSSEAKEGIMLGILAAVLIVLWLLGFFAFHVTTGFIHIVLVVGIIFLVLHFVGAAQQTPKHRPRSGPLRGRTDANPTVGAYQRPKSSGYDPNTSGRGSGSDEGHAVRV
jgi:quinol-cytochrome oxidoreductase complex cytochrome b subunit